MEYKKIYYPGVDETIYAGEHSTGLGVFVIPKKGFSKKYAVIGTKFGSVNNTFVPLGEDKAVTVPDGVSHFLEHKMFEQSDGSNAFDKFSIYIHFHQKCKTYNIKNNQRNHIIRKIYQKLHVPSLKKYHHNITITLYCDDTKIILYK